MTRLVLFNQFGKGIDDGIEVLFASHMKQIRCALLACRFTKNPVSLFCFMSKLEGLTLALGANIQTLKGFFSLTLLALFSL